MKCNKCQTQNFENSLYCINCGEKLSSGDTNQSLNEIKPKKNSGMIRKGIKENAKGKVNGSFIGITGVYFVFSFLLFIIMIIMGYDFDSDDISIIDFALDSVSLFFLSILNYGIINSAFDLHRGKSINFSNVLSKPFINFDKTMTIFIMYLIIYSIVYVIGYLLDIADVVGLFMLIVYFILIICFLPMIETILCVLCDDNYKSYSFKEVFSRAKDLVKGHFVAYYGMMFSFIGWILLGFLTLGVLYIWLIPYMRISLANMYLKWNDEASFVSNRTGLSDGGVIGFIVGTGCGCFSLLVFLAILGAIVFSIVDYNSFEDFLDDFDDNYDYNENYGFDDRKSAIHDNLNEVTLGYGKHFVTFILPKGFDNNDGDNTSIDSVFYNDNYSSISYYVYADDMTEIYEDGVKYLKNHRYQDYRYEDDDFMVMIGDKSIRCHTIKEISNYESIQYEAYLVYPIDEDYCVEIFVFLQEEDGAINQENISKYIMVK